MKLSVLLTTYNCEKYINAAIISILNQTFSEFEFIIVDDGSEDNTEKIIKTIADERIKYYKIEHSGRSKALNFGLTKCNSDWIALMDSDDIAHPMRFEIQLNTIKENTKLDIVSSWYGIFNSDHLCYINKTPVDDKSIKKALLLHSVISNPGVIYRKSVIVNIGGYKQGYDNYGIEDYDMWLRLLDKAKFCNIQKTLIYLRNNPNSASRKGLEGTQRKIYKMQESYIKKYVNKISLDEKHVLLGWREYFYGRKTRALSYWMKLNLKLILEFRILVGIFTLLFPDKYFLEFKELRLKFRFEYLLTYFSSSNKRNRKTFNRILQNKNIRSY